MGGWTFVDPWLELTLASMKIKAKRARYVGRPASASTAAGLMSRHTEGTRDLPRPRRSPEATSATNRHTKEPAYSMTDIMTPALGESVTEATVARWAKKAGRAVKKDEVLVELETDKVSLEVAAPEDGVLAEIPPPEGATVEPGRGAGPGRAPPAPRRRQAGAGQEAAVAAARPPPPRRRSPRRRAPAPSAGPGASGREPARRAAVAVGAAHRRREQPRRRAPSPAPARTAASPRATPWPRWRRAAARGPAAAPAPPPAAAPRRAAPREERVRMTRLRQTIARRLKEAQNTAAMLTTFNEVDMSAVMALRNQYKDAFEKRHGVKLGFMSFFVKACIAALKDVPDGQRRDRRDRPDLQEPLRHRRRRRHRAGPGGAGGARRRRAEPGRHREGHRRRSARRPATARWRWTTCRAAPSPSPTAGSTAR